MTTTVDYQTCREQSQIDQMDASIDKKAISDAVRAGMQEMAVLIDEEGWEYNARMNMAGYVNYWYSNLTWIQNQYDKTLQQIRDLASQENGTEIHMEKVNRLVKNKLRQEASLERAEHYYNESKAFYEKVTEEKYMPYSNKKKTGKDVTKEYKMAILQEALKTVKKTV